MQTIPTFYLTADIDIGRLLAMREEANAAAPKDADGQPAFKLSLNDFIIKAWGGGAAARSRRQCGVGAGPHPAFLATPISAWRWRSTAA